MKQNFFKKKNWNRILIVLLLSFTFLTITIVKIKATPTGASVEFVSNSTKQLTYPENRTDTKGSITILRLNTEQQNDRWKAYVGNVSGVLTLDDANSYTIYDWALVGSVSGTVFASRNDSITWSNINCSNITHTREEENFLGITFTSADSIENTFMSANHTPFVVGTNNIAYCNYTALYVNNTVIVANDSAPYQEVVLYDGAGAFVYATRINDNQLGYRGDDSQYDFQMIVAERANVGALITYFFFVELT